MARHEAVQSRSRRGNCYDNALPGTTHAECFLESAQNRITRRRQLPQSHGSAAGNQPLSRLLQRRAPAFGPRLSRPQSLRNPLSTHVSTLCGLARPPHLLTIGIQSGPGQRPTLDTYRHGTWACCVVPFAGMRTLVALTPFRITCETLCDLVVPRGRLHALVHGRWQPWPLGV